MRDRRFVAEHRGGLLCRADHFLLADWAADCAERVLPLFQRLGNDERPEEAIRIARQWARGEVAAGTAMKASVAAHAAARGADNAIAIAVARAAAQAVATAHSADHCLAASLYALKATATDGNDPQLELDWQVMQVPFELRDMVDDGLRCRLKPMRIKATRQ